MSVVSLIKKIQRNKYSIFQKWSERNKSNGRHRILKAQIRKLLEIISGNDICSLLSDILKNNEKNIIHQKNTSALNNISTHIYLSKTAKIVEKRKLLCQLKNAGLKYSDSQVLGFSCFKRTWYNCDKLNFRKTGRKPLQVDCIEAIQHHLDAKSHVASNKTIKSNKKNEDGTKENIPVRYRTHSKLESYNTCPNRNEFSYSAFYKYIGDYGLK